MSKAVFPVVLLSALLTGCALTPDAEQALTSAKQHYDAVKDDTAVLRSAPKDVARAGESLDRAERLSSFAGSSETVEQFAYLSERYAQIAREHADASANHQKANRQSLELQRLQLLLREAKLLSAQQHNNWLEDQMISLAASNTERGLVMTLGDVLFDTGRAELQPAANRTMLKLVQFLQVNPKRRVRIEGYTDNTGTVEDNLRLSQARAQAVANVLLDLGIDTSRVEVIGHGVEYPIAENASSRGRAQNRRVEIVFSDEQGELGAQRASLTD